MTTGDDVGVLATLAFVRRALGARRVRLLEVGCGDGALARRLADDGHEVVGVDAAEEAVAAAVERGVDARVARWPAWDGDGFDVVLFTRSLHHMDPVPAVDRAADALVPGGLLLADEFDLAAVDPVAIRWVASTARALAREGLLAAGERTVAALATAGDPLAAWRDAHAGPLATAADLVAAVGLRFEIATVDRVPYLFRYLVAGLAYGTAAERGLALRDAERDLVDRGAFRPAGLRIVARLRRGRARP